MVSCFHTLNQIQITVTKKSTKRGQGINKDENSFWKSWKGANLLKKFAIQNP